MDEIVISGKRFISSRRAAKEHGYHADYIGQLIRSKKISGQKVGHNWYVSEASLEAYIRGKEAEGNDSHDEKKETPEEVRPASERSTIGAGPGPAVLPAHEEKAPPMKAPVNVPVISPAHNPESKPPEYKMLTYLPEENNVGLGEKIKPVIHASAPAKLDGSTPIKLTTIQSPLETSQIPVQTEHALNAVPKLPVTPSAPFGIDQTKPLSVAASPAFVQMVPAQANTAATAGVGITRPSQPIHVPSAITVSEDSLPASDEEVPAVQTGGWITIILVIICILLFCGSFAASLLPAVVTVSL